MTENDVKQSVARIAEMAADDEAAHSAEDALYEALLTAIANGTCDSPIFCAREALKTRSIKFARWCA